MAAELFTKYSGIKAFSAGTKVLEFENQKLNEIPLAEPVIRFMEKEGLNVTENTRKQLTPEMIDKFDKIIIMAEPETIPEYLL
jgi:protein-tyrosine-phosphatase